VITSFVAFLTVLSLYLYGGDSLRGMAEAQMHRHHHRHGVLDLRGMPAADHVAC
jgi:hypothetical protein